MQSIFTENGIILPNFKDLPPSSSSKLSLEKFAKYMDKILLEDLTRLHPTLNVCTLYSYFISDYYITIDFTTFTYIIPNHISSKLIECRKNKQVRFYVLPIILKLSDSDSHANVIIIDNKTKTIEMYEPHGLKFLSKDIFYDIEYHIRHLTNILLNKNTQFRFKNVHYKCPIGFQTKQAKIRDGSSYCVAWTLFFIHIRLYNLDLSTTQIIAFLDTFEPNKLDIYIRQYMTLIDNEVKDDIIKIYKDVHINFTLTPQEEKQVKELIQTKAYQYLTDVNTNIQSYSGLQFYDVNTVFKEFIKYSKFEFFHNLYFKTIEKFFKK